MKADVCPHCRAELAYRARDGNTYSRKIGHEIPGVYDGILFWSCPDCGGKWQRWEPGDRLYWIADAYICAP